MVVGRDDHRIDMLYVPIFSDVVHGDRVVTSGLDGIYPRGFGIGTVTRIDTREDGKQQLELRPELDYGSLEEVLVLVEPVGEARFAAPPWEPPPGDAAAPQEGTP
jgi:rod shape-determining protein MreC